MDYVNTLIILPAYNVENAIKPLLLSLTNYRDHLIVIDDGSTDNTYTIVNSLNFKIIRLTENSGVATAIKVGIKYAIEKNYENILLMDADGQHSPKYIDLFLTLLKKYDFVVGNRFNINSFSPDIKLNSNLLASIIVNEITGKKFNDISCGFKAIKLSPDLLSAIKNSNGYSIVFDMFFFAIKSHYKIGTIDMESIYDYGSLLFTRSSEILAFIASLEQHFPEKTLYNLKVYNLKTQLFEQKDFIYEINEFTFYGFYIREKCGYIIQCNPAKIREYLITES